MSGMRTEECTGSVSEYLSRIKNPPRVPQALDALHQRNHVRPCFFEQFLLLAQSDAVFAGTCASDCVRMLDHAGVYARNGRVLIRLARHRHENDVKIAIANVP